MSQPNENGPPPMKAAGAQGTQDAKEGSGSKETQEEKMRKIRERNEEMRQRKLLELETSACLAQRNLDQLEEERKRRIDDMKSRDLEKRQAVEERKRIIWEAEQERKESVLRRNIEREAKLEAKRNAQKNANCFVFGSSTPRSINLDSMLMGSSRKNTPLMAATPVARYNHRGDVNDYDNVRRRPVSAIFTDDRSVEKIFVTSNQSSPFYAICTPYSALCSDQARACLTMIPDAQFDETYGFVGIAPGECLMTQSLYVASAPRRRHPELTPVTPREKENLFSASTTRISKESLAKSVGSDVKQVPKRAVSMTRLDQLARPRQRYLEDTLKSRSAGKAHSCNESTCSSGTYDRSMVKSMSYLPTNPSIKGFAPIRKARSRDGPLSPTRPLSSMSISNTSDRSMSSSVQLRTKTTRKPRPISIAGSVPERKIESMTHSRESRTFNKKPAAPSPALRPSRARSAGAASRDVEMSPTKSDDNICKGDGKPTPPRKPAHVKAAAAARKAAKVESPVTEIVKSPSRAKVDEKGSVSDVKIIQGMEMKTNEIKAEFKVQATAPTADEDSEICSEPLSEQTENSDVIHEIEMCFEKGNLSDDNDIKASDGTSKDEEMSTVGNKKDITEEEYKKVLAEKRRKAKEQAEREAELERQRQEELQRQEEEERRREEEEQRQFEEEQNRLAEDFRRMEEEKLRKAIEEKEKRDEEEKRLKDEEAKQRQDRDDAERKAKEEAEKARIELEERLRKDEEERLKRKQRVEAIMKRTRKTPGKGSSPTNSDGTRTPEPALSGDSSNTSPSKSQEENDNVENLLKQSDNETLIITKSNSTGANSDLIDTNDVMVSSHVLNGKHSDVQKFSPEGRLDAADGNLLDFNALTLTSSSPSPNVTSERITTSEVHLDQLLTFNTVDGPVNQSRSSGDSILVIKHGEQDDPFGPNSTEINNKINLSQDQHFADLMS